MWGIRIKKRGEKKSGLERSRGSWWRQEGGAHGCVGPTQLTCARVFKILCPYGFELTRLTLVLTPACGPWYGKRIF